MKINSFLKSATFISLLFCNVNCNLSANPTPEEVAEIAGQVLEVAGSMGIIPGTTICGLADGNNWAVRTIVNKYRSEFEARCKPSLVPVTPVT